MLVLLPSIASAAEEFALRCLSRDSSEFQILSGPGTNKARLVLDDQVVLGAVKTSETHYELHFPPSETRQETHIVVNRFSGAMTLEHGTAPFGTASKGNILRLGKCYKIEKTPPL
jgi:hypothetical protein